MDGFRPFVKKAIENLLPNTDYETEEGARTTFSIKL